MKLVTPKAADQTWGTVPAWAIQAMQAILHAVRARDPYTYAHCLRVGRMAGRLAEAMQLDQMDSSVAEAAGLLHDVGKIGVPDKILLKPGRLTPEEDGIMRTHPVKSAEIVQPLSPVDFFNVALPGIKHHHERMDGLGYPYGLIGDDIPLMARIVTIVDAYDAITSNRVYRDGRSPEEAFKELVDHSSVQFDRSLVQAFLKAFPTWEEFHRGDAAPEDVIAEAIERRAA